MTYIARRRDGWTAEAQQRFLNTLAETRSVTRAARAAAKSRKSAYALRARGEDFAAAWDRIMAPPPPAPLMPIDVIDVPLTRRGVVLATRRRFDNRAALVRLRQLDRVVDRFSAAQWEEMAGR